MTYSHKTTKFAKVFSLESFPLYGTLTVNVGFVTRPSSSFLLFVLQRSHIVLAGSQGAWEHGS